MDWIKWVFLCGSSVMMFFKKYWKRLSLHLTSERRSKPSNEPAPH